ncbi:hypothetical protein Droror1_Dr00023147, partial [Drosera rotundifolia]
MRNQTQNYNLSAIVNPNPKSQPSMGHNAQLFPLVSHSRSRHLVSLVLTRNRWFLMARKKEISVAETSIETTQQERTRYRKTLTVNGVLLVGFRKWHQGVSRRLYSPRPFQWGRPTFNVGEAFAMMAATLVALTEGFGTLLNGMLGSVSGAAASFNDMVKTIFLTSTLVAAMVGLLLTLSSL